MLNSSNLYRTKSSRRYFRYDGTPDCNARRNGRRKERKNNKKKRHKKTTIRQSKSESRYEQTTRAWRSVTLGVQTKKGVISLAVSSPAIRQAQVIHPKLPSFRFLTSKRVRSLTGTKFKHERGVGFLRLEATHRRLRKSDHLTISQSNASKHASTLRAKQ